MGKKRSYRSDSEGSDGEDDHSMNAAADDNDNKHNNNNSDHDDDDDEGDEPMKESDEHSRSNSKSPTMKKKDMKLRSGKRKRRRSVGTTGLTPPPTSKRASKKAKMMRTAPTTTNGDKKPSAVAFADSSPLVMNNNNNNNAAAAASASESAEKPAASEDSKAVSADDSPAIVDPRRISYSQASGALPPGDQEDIEAWRARNPLWLPKGKDTIDAVPPKPIAHTNGKSRNDSEDAIVETKEPPMDDPNENGVIASEEVAEEEIDLSNETSIESIGKSAGVSTLQRLVIFVVLGYLSLLLTMPQVIKLSQEAVPLDDSILPQQQLTVNTTSVVDEEYEEEEEESDVDPSVALEAWNREFLGRLGKLNQAKTGYSSSKDSLEEYYDQLLDRVNQITAQLQPRRQEIEERLTKLNRLEELLQGFDTNAKTAVQIAPLAQEFLGETILSTSSVELWNIQEDTNVECDLGLEDDYDDDDDDDYLVESVDDETEPLLLQSVLEEKISNLILRSTMTAEKFIGGAVAEDRIRNWVRSSIDEVVDEDEEIAEAIMEIEEFPQLLSQSTSSTTNSGQSDSGQLTQIIQDQLDIHRADITGIYDYASLKNGADIIYGGKRGTSKSLIDELPVLNRILQNSNLKFYGFGPEAALTATFPPNSLGQCWSFGQTSLKEQLKERKLFENDKKVKNDFKRGNFGTLSIRLSEPISVESIVIEHPPMNTPGQANSAIRKFRLVGYEDELATSKAWNLGSFEYNLLENKENNKYLQTFETATTVFGKEIPPLHSISLAIDSNHGHDYSCLYRFRVHGN